MAILCDDQSCHHQHPMLPVLHIHPQPLPRVSGNGDGGAEKWGGGRRGEEGEGWAHTSRAPEMFPLRSATVSDDIP